jgi:lipoprotein-anchoring transpeptidase ErfK/SrfK
MTKIFTSLRWVLPALIATAFTSCAPTSSIHTSTPTASNQPSSPAPAPARRLYEWYDDGGPGEVAIHISLSKQQATYTRGGREIGWSYVTTGRAGQRTPTGSFNIQEKTVDKYSNRWGHVEDEYGNTVNSSARYNDPLPAGQRWVAASMPYWMRITSSGIGLHAGPIPRPGTPVSAGCIRLPRQLAPQVFEVVKIGTPVRVSP